MADVMMHTEAEGRSRIFYGWWIVIACAAINFLCNMARTSFTMFFPALLEDLGWSRSLLGFGNTLHAWAASFTALIAGILLDKYGPRALITFGGLLTIIGLAFASRMTYPWEFFLWFGVVHAIGGAATTGVPTHITGRKWFIRRAGLAVAISSIGGTLGMAGIALAGPILLANFGWRDAWFLLAFLSGGSTMAIAWAVIRKDPESMGLRPDGDPPLKHETGMEEIGDVISAHDEHVWTVREGLRFPSYWYLVIAHAIVAIPGTGAVAHIIVWGLDKARILGIPAPEAMSTLKWAFFFLAIGAVMGGLIGGPLSDKIGRKIVAIVSFFLFGINWLIAIYITSLWGVVAFAFGAAFLSGLHMPFWPSIMGDIFGRRSMATLYGLLILCGGLIGGSGAFLFGWIFDTFGTYNWAFIMSIIVSVAGTFFIWMADTSGTKQSI
jgi:MFS family permease